MQLFFIDESGTIPPEDKIGDTNYFALGGIVIPENLWYEIDKGLDLLRRKFQITGEIKWRYFSPVRIESPKNSLSHLDHKMKEELRVSIYDLITKLKSVRLICALVDIKNAYKLKYVNCENDLYWFAYKQMT